MEVTETCCDREPKGYIPTIDDPLAQICNECKADKRMKECIATMRILDAERRLQVIQAFAVRSDTVEVKGYRLVKGPLVIGVYDVDRVLEYIEGMKAEDALIVEPLDEEYFNLLCFVREDGEQLDLNIKDKG